MALVCQMLTLTLEFGGRSRHLISLLKQAGIIRRSSSNLERYRFTRAVLLVLSFSEPGCRE